MKIARIIDENRQMPEDETLSSSEIFEMLTKKYSLKDTKQKLSEWLEVALTTENLFYDDAKSREELYGFYHMLMYTMEGIFQLQEKERLVKAFS